MSRIAIIPARGGSKRLPRKNILPVLGRPMIAYSIKTALNSGLFDEVVVSTEDNEIADIAHDAGATIIQRPDSLATDRSTVVQVCCHALDYFEQRGTEIELFCCIYATSVFISIDDLRLSLKLMNEDPVADFVMGVSAYEYPPVQALTIKDGFLRLMWPEFEFVQSQFYPHLVVSNGTFYWARSEIFKNIQSFYGEKLKGYEVPPDRVIDVNNFDDYKAVCNKALSLL